MKTHLNEAANGMKDHRIKLKYFLFNLQISLK